MPHKVKEYFLRSTQRCVPSNGFLKLEWFARRLNCWVDLTNPKIKKLDDVKVEIGSFFHNLTCLSLVQNHGVLSGGSQEF